MSTPLSKVPVLKSIHWTGLGEGAVDSFDIHQGLTYHITHIYIYTYTISYLHIMAKTNIHGYLEHHFLRPQKIIPPWILGQSSMMHLKLLSEFSESGSTLPTPSPIPTPPPPNKA